MALFCLVDGVRWMAFSKRSDFSSRDADGDGGDDKSSIDDSLNIFLSQFQQKYCISMPQKSQFGNVIAIPSVSVCVPTETISTALVCVDLDALLLVREATAVVDIDFDATSATEFEYNGGRFGLIVWSYGLSVALVSFAAPSFLFVGSFSSFACDSPPQRFFLSRRSNRFLYFCNCLSRCDRSTVSSLGDSSSKVQRCFPFSLHSTTIGCTFNPSAPGIFAKSCRRGMDFMRGKLFSDTCTDNWSVIIDSGKLCSFGVDVKHDVESYARMRYKISNFGLNAAIEVFLMRGLVLMSLSKGEHVFSRSDQAVICEKCNWLRMAVHSASNDIDARLVSLHWRMIHCSKRMAWFSGPK